MFNNLRQIKSVTSHKIMAFTMICICVLLSIIGPYVYKKTCCDRLIFQGPSMVFTVVVPSCLQSLSLIWNLMAHLLISASEILLFTANYACIQPNSNGSYVIAEWIACKHFDTQNHGSTWFNCDLYYGTILVHVAFIVSLSICNKWLTEYERKAQFAGIHSFRNEQDNVENVKDINRLLINNILPAHVATYYLQPDGPQEELFSETKEHVCVMFASIPKFNDFWCEWDESRKLECLRLLNEIVCEFDKLLMRPKFSGVEKIKTVGSTYMAATGLQPSQTDPSDAPRYVKTMVDFAIRIMMILEGLNRDSFQSFELRIGMSFGPVVAGVIGAQKPQYDIWGHTVNMASRMDSHGFTGKIHMTQQVADHLHGKFDIKSNGLVQVKGVRQKIETFIITPEF